MMNAVVILVVAVIGLAVATKPGPDRFERFLDESFQRAQADKAKREQFLDALIIAGVGALKNGEYRDYLVASSYRVMFLGKPVTLCYGYLGQISCGHDG